MGVTEQRRWRHWKRALAVILPRQAKIIDRDVQVSIHFLQPEERDGVRERVANSLVHAGLPFETHAGARTGIHILMKGIHKQFARDFLISHSGLDPVRDADKIWVLGNEFEDSPTSDLGLTLPNAHNVSVGRTPYALPFLSHTDLHGWRGTESVFAGILADLEQAVAPADVSSNPERKRFDRTAA
jgi:hypothetical protein